MLNTFFTQHLSPFTDSHNAAQSECCKCSEAEIYMRLCIRPYSSRFCLWPPGNWMYLHLLTCWSLSIHGWGFMQSDDYRVRAVNLQRIDGHDVHTFTIRSEFPPARMNPEQVLCVNRDTRVTNVSRMRWDPVLFHRMLLFCSYYWPQVGVSATCWCGKLIGVPRCPSGSWKLVFHHCSRLPSVLHLQQEPLLWGGGSNH